MGREESRMGDGRWMIPLGAFISMSFLGMSRTFLGTALPWIRSSFDLNLLQAGTLTAEAEECKKCLGCFDGKVAIFRGQSQGDGQGQSPYFCLFTKKRSYLKIFVMFFTLLAVSLISLASFRPGICSTFFFKSEIRFPF
jgi:hydrogenase/urease accessory protein HupE